MERGSLWECIARCGQQVEITSSVHVRGIRVSGIRKFGQMHKKKISPCLMPLTPLEPSRHRLIQEESRPAKALRCRPLCLPFSKITDRDVEPQ